MNFPPELEQKSLELARLARENAEASNKLKKCLDEWNLMLFKWKKEVNNVK